MFFNKNRLIQFTIVFFIISTRGFGANLTEVDDTNDADVHLHISELVDFAHEGGDNNETNVRLHIVESTDGSHAAGPDNFHLAPVISNAAINPDQDNLNFRSREYIGFVYSTIGMQPNENYILESIILGRRVAITLVPFAEAAIHIIPVMLACLSDQSPEIASASFAQNVIYTGIYGGFLIKNLYGLSRGNMSCGGKILTGMCMTNTALGASSCFSSWQYLETSQYNYKAVNTALNIASGSIGLISRIVVKGPEILRSWYSRELPPFLRIYRS